MVQVQLGSYLKKYCRKRFKSPHERNFQIDMDYFILKWSSPKKPMTDTQIFLADITRIVPGDDSDFWRGKPEEKAYGIEILAPSRNLRLVCPNSLTWNMWFTGLLFAHQKAIEVQRLTGGSLTIQYIKRQWDLTDANEDGRIQFTEFLSFLKRMKVPCDTNYARELFSSCQATSNAKEDSLTFAEFKVVIQRLLTHADIMAFFTQYHDPLTRMMGKHEIQCFLSEVQLEDHQEIQRFYKMIESLSEPFKDSQSQSITDLGFNFLLTQEKCNSIFDPSKQRVYQSMDRPFAAYYIASSHNTYLTSDQIVGKSAVGQYIDVLLKGCRCVELDCWDGTDGEPIIYHGHTLTSKIPFQAVVKACRDYGFKSSPYPIIFSLEMHCSAKQKQRIGEILREELGNVLYIGDPNGTHSPSPEQLKHRILVKGKVPDLTGFREEDEGNEDDLDMEEREIREELLDEFPCAYCTDVELGHMLLQAKAPSRPISVAPRSHIGNLLLGLK
eukprot:Gregarina_sp_Poly_1__5087@NODE_2698_length_1811_cov_81_551606_g266_i1_p1_GENE_NODE_2698_length_1811_cov_81_551606_g266_i1NODE_2698_length_1811_cov_81_551606_g266_i1_p1_ORF_typecomplete_len575_score64_11PIPLCX/PF00388_19/1_2e04PIPLCX/PF00388_19/1_5e53Mcp5_PH/PF12814_7/1_5e10EFhand_10/PF14788_6/0_6EFhand_10/PF14788_6/8_7e06EFhand_10/PF14788_6/1_6e03EFhand_10/PF14788_6/1_3e04EFhand_like/PF09279_11/12EFhand_like/PF09279_11/0_0043EFhand_7/PF13499_6/0_067EFhand_7/PF13499_6/0_023EFhand_7/PF13499_6/7_4e